MNIHCFKHTDSFALLPTRIILRTNKNTLACLLNLSARSESYAREISVLALGHINFEHNIRINKKLIHTENDMLGNLHLTALDEPLVAMLTALKIDAKLDGSSRMNHETRIEGIKRALGKIKRAAIMHVRPARLRITSSGSVARAFDKAKSAARINICRTMLRRHTPCHHKSAVGDRKAKSIPAWPFPVPNCASLPLKVQHHIILWQILKLSFRCREGRIHSQ